ncbi:unnamed protein product [Boreogadus saida]
MCHDNLAQSSCDMKMGDHTIAKAGNMLERVASRVATRYPNPNPASISPDLLIGTPISPCTNGTLHARQMEKQQDRTKVLGSTKHQTSGATGNDQQASMIPDNQSEPMFHAKQMVAVILLV